MKEQFKKCLKESSHLVILSGAGVSAESGIPTFRGAGGYWRTYSAMDLACPSAWGKDPGLVWEFYNYRRKIMGDKKPNPGHYAMAEIEKKLTTAGKKFTLITQNIDDLHFDSGSRNVVRLHGSLWQLRCLSCNHINSNRDVPITPAYEGSGSPDPDHQGKHFTHEDLPHCNQDGCGGILRPHVVWFGESLDGEDVERASQAVESCDLFLVVGTSALVYPAAGYIGRAQRIPGTKTCEINLEATPASSGCDFVFQGKAGDLLPELLNVDG